MDKTFSAERAQRIKNERLRLGYTQQEVAEKCGIRRQQWIRYEKGTSVLDGKVLREFITLGADFVYIFGGEKSTPDQLAEAQRWFSMMATNTDEDMFSAISAIGGKQIQAKRRTSEVEKLRNDILEGLPDMEDIERLQTMRLVSVLDKEDLEAVHKLIARLAIRQ